MLWPSVYLVLSRIELQDAKSDKKNMHCVDAFPRWLPGLWITVCCVSFTHRWLYLSLDKHLSFQSLVGQFWDIMVSSLTNWLWPRMRWSQFNNSKMCNLCGKKHSHQCATIWPWGALLFLPLLPGTVPRISSQSSQSVKATNTVINASVYIINMS